MVDLVKIRKKKAESRKQKAEAEAAIEAAQPVVADKPATQQPVDVPPPPSPPPPPPAAQPRDRETAQPQPSKLDKFKEQAGKRREAEAGQIAEEETAPESQLELLTFVIAREQYAVDIERIVEIVTPRALTRIPNADASVVGIISLRGTIVTLVDVRKKLGHPPAGEDTADTRIVVIDQHNEMIGFIVDRVLRVVKTGAETIEPHPVVHSTELDESIRGVFRVSDALTILLDLDKLLAEKQKAESRNQK
jgi:purine-binding chemotaxis protein CheW